MDGPHAPAHLPAGLLDVHHPRGLKALIDQFGPGGESQWEVVVTASVITTLPMILLFFLGQRHFVEGVATTGSKG